jgi:hypothetical protein
MYADCFVTKEISELLNIPLEEALQLVMAGDALRGRQQLTASALSQQMETLERVLGLRQEEVGVQ